jgi:hypothetical protein
MARASVSAGAVWLPSRQAHSARLSDVYHRKVFPSFDAAPLSDDAYDEALRDYPTVICEGPVSQRRSARR